MSHRLTLNPFVLLVALLGAYVVLALLPITGAGAQTTTTGGGTVIICEATGNPNAPYVEVDVAQADLGNYGAAEGDIIPAPPGGCPRRAAGTTGPTNRPHPHRRPARHPARVPTAVPHLSPTPPSSTAPQPASAPAPIATSAPAESATPTTSVHSLPKTGGDTLITIVLGALLLYCGAVIRWAAAAPHPGPVSTPRH